MSLFYTYHIIVLVLISVGVKYRQGVLAHAQMHSCTFDNLVVYISIICVFIILLFHPEGSYIYAVRCCLLKM